MEFLLRRIQEGGEPVLELGCGTGRVLVPLLERGIDAAGIDVSRDMLAGCRAKCDQRSLPAALELQRMETLDLPRRFGTIFLGSGGMGVLISDEDALATFRGALAHLKPGGVLSAELQTPPESSRFEERAGLWTGEWSRTTDGAILAVRLVYKYDAETHIRTSLMVLERYVDGRLVATETQESAMRFWQVATVTRLLAAVGFIDIIASTVFTDNEPPGDNSWLVVRARRPS